MAQDATLSGGRPRPRRHCVRWGPSSRPTPPTERVTAVSRPLFFCWCQLLPNSCPSQQLLSSCWATVCKTVRPMPSDRCLSCLSALSVLSVTLVYCGQMVGWIKMKLAMQVGLNPLHIVLDGDPAPLPHRGTAPQFLAHICCGQMTGRIKMPLHVEVGRCSGDCVRWGPSFPSPKRGPRPLPPIFG